MDSGLVFKHQDAVEFLNAYFKQLQDKNSMYSMRAFSRKLGSTVSTVSRVLSGKRDLTIKLTRKWISKLDLSKTEQKFFLLLVLKQNAETDLELELFQDLVSFMKENGL